MSSRGAYCYRTLNLPSGSALLTTPPDGPAMLPLPFDDLQVISIDSLEVALAKMEIKVSVNDIIAVIREVEEAKRAGLMAQATNAEHRGALSERKSSTTAAHLLSSNQSNMLVTLHPPEESSGLQFTPTPYLVPDPPRLDPVARERRRRLVELIKQTFLDGRVPDPFAFTGLTLSQDATANRLPQATRSIVTSVEDQTDNPSGH